MTDQLYAAVEAGGTKIICGIGTAERGSLETARIETADARPTIQAVIDFFMAARRRHGPIQAAGIASFGPLDLDPDSPSWGRITTTPKPGWQGVDLRGRIADALDIPTGINTDVNAAALAEAWHGAARGCKNVAYVTVGTGIGVGLLSGGRMVHGLGHPEAGHLRLRRHDRHFGFDGICPYHGDCLEGLASGPAIKAAWGASLDMLATDHAAWEVEADYLAQLCATLILTVAPEHIVLGGGVMSQSRLLPVIRAATVDNLAGYAAAWAEPDATEARITGPGCKEPSGLIGAYLIAEESSRLD